MAWGMVPVQANDKKNKNGEDHVFKYARGNENAQSYS